MANIHKYHILSEITEQKFGVPEFLFKHTHLICLKNNLFENICLIKNCVSNFLSGFFII